MLAVCVFGLLKVVVETTQKKILRLIASIADSQVRSKFATVAIYRAEDSDDRNTDDPNRANHNRRTSQRHM